MVTECKSVFFFCLDLVPIRADEKLTGKFVPFLHKKLHSVLGFK
jgi:hypothetical protein